jgi:hypothetical protein
MVTREPLHKRVKIKDSLVMEYLLYDGPGRPSCSCMEPVFRLGCGIRSLVGLTMSSGLLPLFLAITGMLNRRKAD